MLGDQSPQGVEGVMDILMISSASPGVGGDWWDLLRELLAAADTPGSSSVHHSAVAATLMDRGHTLPPWLLEQYTVSPV